MKNSFNLEVNFNNSPVYSYEWTRSDILINAHVLRVSSAFLNNVLVREGKLDLSDKQVVLSDIKNAVAIKLGKDGRIAGRSFLKFQDELDVCEYAANLKETKVDADFTDELVHYDRPQPIEVEMKKYLIDTVRGSGDEDLPKYLYYLYFHDIKGYSKDKLISSIETSSIDENMKVYKFLIES